MITSNTVHARRTGQITASPGPRTRNIEEARAVCAAAMLGSSIQAILDAGVLSAPAVAQAKKVHRWFTDAVYDAIPGGITPAMGRKIYKQSHEILRIGQKIMPEKMHHIEFIFARVLAGWYFIDNQMKRGYIKNMRPWRYLEQTCFTFMCMLVPELSEYEEKMQALADEMFYAFQN